MAGREDGDRPGQGRGLGAVRDRGAGHPVLLHDLGDVVATSVAVALVAVLTASGLGSVLGWAGRLTLSQLTAMGDLLVGALPVVLLTVLVFFNSPVWVMASTISRERLWVAVAFLVLIAATFVVSRLLNRARPTLETATVSPRHAERLEGTPFETLPDLAAPERLTRLERANVVFVLAATQMAQILMVAIVTGIIFLMLGLIVLSPELLALWTRNGPSEGTVFGMMIPVPQALIHVTMFLGALTFMYVSARAVVDTEYRERFLDPLIDDLKLTLLARNRYRAHVRALGVVEMKVLVVEDEARLASTLTVGLQAEGFDVVAVANGIDGLAQAVENRFDVVLLDIMLPGLNGYEVLRRMRARGVHTPVMMLTAKDGEYDQTDAFELGADDYLTKPFSFIVLVARLRALLRRSAPQRPPVLRAGSLSLDPARRRVERDGTVISLTPREFGLLEYLMRQKDSVVTKAQILDAVWDADFDGADNVVEVYVGYVRRKIDVPFGTKTIDTVRGVGYRLDSGEGS